MTRILHGIVHGRTIELTEEPGIGEGQEVHVQVTIPVVRGPVAGAAQPQAAEENAKWGEGLLRTAGALANDPDWDRIMQEVHDARKLPRRAAIDQP